MTREERAARKASRQSRRRLEEQEKILDIRRARGLDEERKELVSEDNRTVRDNYDNASALYKRKKNLKRKILYGFLSVVLCSMGIVALSALFFQIKNIEVVGSEYYDAEMLASACPVLEGDNLLLLDTQKIEDTLCMQFPYIETATVRRKLPDTLLVEVTEAGVAYALFTQGKAGEYTLLSAGEKVLETGVTTLPEKVCLLLGVEAVAPVPGSTVQFGGASDEDLILTLLGELSKNGLTELNRVDLSDSMNLSVRYEDRLDIAIGTAAQLDYKIRFAKRLIDTEIGQMEYGTIDVRNAAERTATFQPASAEGEEEENVTVLPEQAQSVPLYDESIYDPNAERPHTNS